MITSWFEMDSGDCCKTRYPLCGIFFADCHCEIVPCKFKAAAKARSKTRCRAEEKGRSATRKTLLDSSPHTMKMNQTRVGDDSY